MNKKALHLATAVVMAFSIVFTWASCSRETGSKIVIKGSTTVLPITQKAAEAFKKSNPKISISIEGSGSGNGIKAIIDGSCEIANSSREMKPEEIVKAKARGVVIKEIIVGIDMLCPVIHPSNPVKDLTLVQLKGIYDGSITNWKQIGGGDQNIVVISRDTSSGTYESWNEKVMKKSDVRRDALLQASNGAVVSSVAENPRAIGYIGYGYINDSIKSITVNNIEATIENGKSGKFPLARNLYMYINTEKISEHSMAFIDFLTGVEGQALVKEAGFIPVR